MAKKKKSGGSKEGNAENEDVHEKMAPQVTPTPPPPRSTTSTPTKAPNPWFSSKPKNGEPSTSALIICRNK
jgi:hypothetical protein